jgi:hypothetical protein
MGRFPIVLKALRLVLIAALLLTGVDFALRLMNESNTLSFIAGLLLMTAMIGLPIEYIYRKNQTNKNK